MSRIEQAVIVNREAQSSDTALYRKDLPKSGKLTALDIGIRLTNGSTSNINGDLLDVIKHLSLVCNGNDYKWHVSGQELFRYHWIKNGKPMPYTWTEAASGVNECWFRFQFGRFMGDPMYGLDLSRFNNVQVQVDYDCTILGAAAVTTFTTATFTVTIIAHQFPYNTGPSFRGMIGLREFYTGTSVASGDLVQDLPSALPIIALGVHACEDNIAEATDITDVKIGKDNFSTVWINGKWYNFQVQQTDDLDETKELFDLLLSAGATKNVHLANIKRAAVNDRSMTLGAA